MTSTEDLSPIQKLGLVRHGNPDPELQYALVSDPSSGIRAELAAQPILLPELQRTLTSDRNEHVRSLLAQNPSLLPELQQVLARDEALHVRRALTWNPAFALTHQLPVAFFASTSRTQAYFDSALEGTDPAARAVLERDWVGTLEELLAALRSFA